MDGLGGLLASIPGWLMGFYHHQMNHVSKLRDMKHLKKHIDIYSVYTWSVSQSNSGGQNLHDSHNTINCHPVFGLMAYVIINRLLCSSLSPKCFRVWCGRRKPTQHVNTQLNRWWAAALFHHYSYVYPNFLIERNGFQCFFNWFLDPFCCAFRTTHRLKTSKVETSLAWRRGPFLQKLQVVSLESGVGWCEKKSRNWCY